MIRRFTAMCWLAAWVALAAAPAQSAGGCELYSLMNARLSLMRDVAAYKWHKRLDIEDREREAEVVARSVADALRVGLEPEAARAFFRAQIEAAKTVQQHWFARWSAGESPPPARLVPDLATTLRPQLLELGAQIVEATAEDHACLGREMLAASIDVVGLSAADKAALFAAASGLRLFANRLQQVQTTGQLRVGTTGDYAPFSHRASTERPFVGVDIDMARDLAATLGATAVFVPTSWPELMADLARGAFDVGMSGVSVTVERQRQALFSRPYYSGGKTPIARCAEVERFASLADIDQTDVRVIVNPGGTNERFVTRNIHLAQLVRHPDNRSIFLEIVAGRADVMITDRIEVQLQSAKHSALCATMATNLNRQDKAYLLPQDPVWREFVDAWLGERLRNGVVDAAFSRHGIEVNRN